MAFAGIYLKNYDPKVPYQIYALALMAFIGVLALAKIVIIIVKSIKDPISYSDSSDKYQGTKTSFQVTDM